MNPDSLESAVRQLSVPGVRGVLRVDARWGRGRLQPQRGPEARPPEGRIGGIGDNMDIDDIDHDEWEALWLPRFVEAMESHKTVMGVHLAGFRFGWTLSTATTAGEEVFDREEEGEDARNGLSEENEDEEVGGGGEGGRVPPHGAADNVVGRRHHHPVSNAAARAAAQHFFGTVLPRHETLTFLGLEGCQVDPQLLRSFFRAIPPHKEFKSVTLMDDITTTTSDGLDARCYDALADGLRNRVRIERLMVVSKGGLDSDRYKSICDGAATNPHLRHLMVRRTSGDDDNNNDGWGTPLTIDHVRSVLEGKTTSIRCLQMFEDLCPQRRSGSLRSADGGAADAEDEDENSWDPNFFRDVVRALRTNTSLIVFHFVRRVDPSPEDVQLILAVLRTYNFTLQEVRIDAVGNRGPPPPPMDRTTATTQGKIDAVLFRNRRLWQAFNWLKLLPSPRVGTGSGEGKPLWPEAIVRIQPFPTLLYRYLRHGGAAVAMVESSQ